MENTVSADWLPESLASRINQVFPTLTSAQIARIASHGRVRPIARGDVLMQAGDRVVPFFVVKSGTVEIFRPSGDTEAHVTFHGPGQFNGEINMLSGRRTLGTARVVESG